MTQYEADLLSWYEAVSDMQISLTRLQMNLVSSGEFELLDDLTEVKNSLIKPKSLIVKKISEVLNERN